MAASAGGTGPDGGEQRLQYSSKLELMLTLVGYAVGLGNIWRFPYLTYSYGGGAFLVPYACALVLLGLPLFILELGLGQMFRQGTLGIWQKLGLPRLQGAGAAATICTFLVSLYYNVILAWTIYYLGRTFGSIFSGHLPWDDQVEGFTCSESKLFPRAAVAGQASIIDAATGLYNRSHAADFWCPPKSSSEVPPEYVSMTVRPVQCPAYAAVQFWETQALQQSSGMDDLGGFQGGMLLSYTLAWLLVYLCVCKGIASSGKVVYVTATLPYVALIVFFFRAITLPNAMKGIEFYVKPDFSLLFNGEVWLRAVTQIFYSLGVGFGSLIAFASYGNKNSDFVSDAVKVSLINCGTSVFGGFVVFPILGFLAQELSGVNPCIQAGDISGLASVGLSGTGLAFIAFPIAISQMPGGIVWALLFFLMLLCLGIDSQFAMVESVITVLHDAGADDAIAGLLGWRLPKPAFAAGICFLSYLLGLIFVTRAGVYWFNLFDYYTCVVAMFFVTFMECFGLMWANRSTWPAFAERVEEWTGRRLGTPYWVAWKFFCPALLLVLLVFCFTSWDLQGARESRRYPEGTGYLPGWSIAVGWFLGLLPVLGFVAFALLGGRSRTGTKAAEAAADPGVACCKAAAAPATPAGGFALPPRETSAPAVEPTAPAAASTAAVDLEAVQLQLPRQPAAEEPRAKPVLQQCPLRCNRCLPML